LVIVSRNADASAAAAGAQRSFINCLIMSVWGPAQATGHTAYVARTAMVPTAAVLQQGTAGS
jgi:hypothetical protein